MSEKLTPPSGAIVTKASGTLTAPAGAIVTKATDPNQQATTTTPAQQDPNTTYQWSTGTDPNYKAPQLKLDAPVEEVHEGATEMDMHSYVKAQEKSYANVKALNEKSKVYGTEDRKSDADILEDGYKALTVGSFISNGGVLAQTKSVGSVKDPVLGVNVPTLQQKFSVDGPVYDPAATRAMNEAAAIFKTPQNFSPEDIQKTTGKAEKAMKDELIKLKNDRELISAYHNDPKDWKSWIVDQDVQDQLESVDASKIQGLHTKFAGTINPSEAVKQLDEKMAFVSDNLRKLKEGSSKLLSKRLDEDFTNPEKVTSLNNMSSEELMNYAIGKGVYTSNPTDLAAASDELRRATTLDPEKAKKNKELLAGTDPILAKSPIAMQMAGSSIYDNYQMDPLRRQELGYAGMNSLLDNLGTAQKQDTESLNAMNRDITEAQDAYIAAPTTENKKKYDDLINGYNDYIKQNIAPKANLYDKISKTIDDQFVGLQLHDALQNKVDQLNKASRLHALYNSTVGTVEHVIMNQMILGSYAFAKKTANGLNSSLTPEQRDSKNRQVDEAYNALKMPTPKTWDEMQGIEWKEDDLLPRLHPTIALHSAVEMATQMAGFIAGGEAVGLPMRGIGYALGGDAGALAASTGLTGFGGRVFGMALAQSAMFGNEMLNTEELKGLSFGDAYRITMARIMLQSVAQEALFSPMHLLHGPEVTAEMLSKTPEVAFKEAAASYKKVFGKDLTPEMYKYIFKTKDALKAAAYPMLAQSAVALTNDLTGYMLDKHIQNSISPDYEVKDISAKSEFLNVMNTMASMFPMGVKDAFESHYGKINNSIRTARYLVAKEADLHLANIASNLEKGLISPEVAARQADFVDHLRVVHELTSMEDAYKAIETTKWSEGDKERARINLFNDGEKMQKLVHLIEKNPSDKRVERMSELLAEISKENLKTKEDIQKAQGPMTAEEAEAARVEKETNMLKTEFSETAVEMKLDPNELDKTLEELKKNAENEPNEKLKKLYEEKAAKVEERIATLRKPFAEGRTVGFNSVDNTYYVADQDGTLIAEGFKSRVEAENHARTAPVETVETVQPVTVPTPREELTDYAKDEMGLKQTAIDDMTDEELQKAVDDHKDLTSGKLEKDIDQRISLAKKKATVEEQSDALYNLWEEMADQGYDELAAKVRAEYDALQASKKAAEAKANEIPFGGRTFQKGNYVLVGDRYYMIHGLEDVNGIPKLVVGPREKPWTMKVDKVEKLGEEITPSEFTEKMNQAYGKEPEDLTQEEAEKALEDPATNELPEEPTGNPVVTSTESQDQAKEEQLKRENPVNPLRSIREENTNEPSHQVWTNTVSKLAADHATADELLKAGYTVVVMNSNEIPVEHMRSDYPQYVAETLKGDRTKDTGKHLVIADINGEPIKFNEKGEKDENGKWAISELPVVYGDKIAKALTPTEEQLTAAGKTKQWFLDQIAKLKKIRATKEKQHFTIEAVSEGNSVQNYNKPQKIEKALKGQKATLEISKGKDINGYPTKKGVLYATVEGSKEPIRLESPAISTPMIDAIIELSKKTLASKTLEGLTDEQRKNPIYTSSQRRMEYLRKLIYSGLNTAIDFTWGSGHGVYRVEGGKRVGEPMTDEQLRDYLKTQGINSDAKSLRADGAFPEITWDGEKFVQKDHASYSDFLKENFDTYTENTAREQKKSQYIELGTQLDTPAGRMQKAAEETYTITLKETIDVDPEVIQKLIPELRKLGWDEQSIEKLTKEQAQELVDKKTEAPKVESQPAKVEETKLPETKDLPITQSKTGKGRKRRNTAAERASLGDTTGDSGELGSGLKGTSTELERSKRLESNTTAEQERVAKAWFDSSPLAKHMNFRDFRAIVNSDAWATWSTAATTLYHGGKYSDLYHEAWHEFSQMYLTPEQKLSLYDEISKTEQGSKALEGKTTPHERAKAIEELIAEDFRKYALSDGKIILDGRPARNGIFRQVWRAIKEFFTGKVDLQTYYERLHKGELNRYQRNADNAFFGYLNKGIEGTITDGDNGVRRVRQLDNRQTRSLYKAIDSLIGRAFANAKIPITKMFEKNNSLNEAYNEANKYLRRKYAETLDHITELEDQLDAVTDEKEAESLENQLQHWNSVADNLQFTVQNWETVVKSHKDYSPFMAVSSDHVYFNPKGEIIEKDAEPTEGDESTDEANSRDAAVVKNENGSSSQAAASNQVVYLIATLPHVNKDGTPVRNEFLPLEGKTADGKDDGIADTVDFATTWNTLSGELSGMWDYNQMINKIKELGVNKPEYAVLAERLTDPNHPGPLSFAELQLRNAFLNDLSKPTVLVKEVVAEKKGNKLEFKYFDAASTGFREILKDSRRVFQDLNPATNSFIKRDPDSGNNYLDYAAVKAAFGPVFDAKSKMADAERTAKKVEFLQLLGFKFSTDTLSDPDFLNLVNGNAGKYIYQGLGYLHQVMTESGKVIDNPLQQLGKTQYSGKGATSRSQLPNISDLINIELRHSDKYFSESATNAADDLVWQKQAWSYLTKAYAHLNNVEKYPTYGALLAEPHLQQFDIEKNPFANGIYLNSLFRLDVDRNDPNYGQRRYVKKGDSMVPVQVDLQNYNGLKITSEDSKGFANEGKTTTNLTAFEKFIQNFNSLLKQGIAEHMRYGDKSSAYATTISGLYDPYSGGVDGRKLFIPIEDFGKVNAQEWEEAVGHDINYVPDRMFSTLMTYLEGDVKPMRGLLVNGIGKDWYHFRENGKDFGVMDNMMSAATKKAIMESPIFTNPGEVDVRAELSKFEKVLRKDFNDYFSKQTKVIQEQFKNVRGVLKRTDLIDSDLLTSKDRDRDSDKQFSMLTAAYAANQILAHIEHLKLIVGDPRFSKAKGGKKDLFKRLSQFSATGNMMVVDDQTNATIQANHPRLLRQALIDRTKTDIPLKTEDGHILSVIFKDVEYKSTELAKIYKKALMDKFGMTSEKADVELTKYGSEDLTEPDGQGYTTLDEYKQAKLRSGSSHWTAAHEAAYKKEVAFMKGESTEGMSLAEQALFVPQKWQYSGSSLTADGYAIPAFYKFSVVPLIPSMIKGTSFEQIHENMIRQNVGLGLFNSGSKHSAVVDAQGKFNPFYADYKTRTPFTGDYTKNKIFYQYLKEQVNIEPKEKKQVTFSTQMRKLLHLNLFTHGVPDDFKGTRDAWEGMSRAEKLAASKSYKLEQDFGRIVDGLINIERKNVLHKMGAKEDSKGNYTLDASKLAEYLQAEFTKRGMPDEAIDFLQAYNGRFKWPLDASTQRDKIEKVIMSIANKNLVQQKINGDALIQVASTGFELNNSKLKNATPEDLQKWGDGNDLPFYLPDGRTTKDGEKVTSAMKIKVALTKRWEPLLELTHSDGQKIGTIDRLNESIKNEKWLNQADNRKMISMVGVRIPVQGLNSHEFMEVYHFLPAEAGNVVIVSPQLVVKSGGDFDIDKLTTYMPNIVKGKDGAAPTLATGEGKAGLENALIDNIRTTLEGSYNFRQLIRPNDTDLFKPYADMLKGDKSGSWTDLVEPMENLRQFSSNLVGKSNLGIAAVNNTLFALLQRSGMYLNPTFTNDKGKEVPVRINMDHNTVSIGGKKFISVSGQEDVHKEHLISDAISQFINGFVDVAKDDWVFYINGVREMVPTMLYATMAGVNNKTLLGFFNQPIMKEYVQEFQKNKSLFMKMTDAQAFQVASRIAKENMFFKTPVDNPVLQAKVDAVKQMYNEHSRLLGLQEKLEMFDPTLEVDRALGLLRDFEVRDQKGARLKETEELMKTPEGKLAELDSRLKMFDDARNDLRRTKNKAFNDLVKEVQDVAAKTPDLFTRERLYGSVFEGKQPLSRADQLKVFAHFIELNEQANKLTSLQTTLNADTKKAPSMYALYDREERRKEVGETNLFPQHLIDRITNESTVRGFLNSENGFDKFASKLFNNTLFEVTNHPLFNTKLRQLIADPDFGIPFAKRNSAASADETQRVFKNDFIQYLFQNYVYAPGTYTLVSDLTKPLFKSENGLAQHVKDLKVKYPDITEHFPFLDLLGSDKARKVDINSVFFRRPIFDADELNSITQQLQAMKHFSDPDYTPAEQREIQQFATDFNNFAFMQSGLNRSMYYMSDVIPNSEHSPALTPAIEKFRELLDTDPKTAERVIQSYANMFRRNNPKFFDTGLQDKDGNVVDYNYNSSRFKNYKHAGAYDLLGIRGAAAAEQTMQYIKDLAKRVVTAEKTRTTNFLTKNPKDLVVVEDNAVGVIKAQFSKQKLDNFSDIVTKGKATSPLTDATLSENVNKIEEGVQAILEKSKKYDKLVFPKDGIGQHLITEAPKTFKYLSERLNELFGYENPGAELISEPPIEKKDPYELAVESAKKRIFAERLREDENSYYLDFPEGFKLDPKADFEELDEKYGKPIDSLEAWDKAQEMVRKYGERVLSDPDGGETTFEAIKAAGDEITIWNAEGNDYMEFHDVEDMINDWRHERIEPEYLGAAEEFLKEHGLIKYKTYDPNQLELFREEDFEGKGNDTKSPC